MYVPNGFDLEAVATTDARRRLEEVCGRTLDGPVLLSVGTICAEKDTCGLLRAFALLARELPDATLVCVGGTRGRDYAARVQRRLDRLNLQERVLLTGPVADAWRLMAGADVFCLSSRTEAMPNVIVEAMSQGVPIVATTVGDVGRLDADGGAGSQTLLRQRENALLVPPRDPPALAAALLAAFNDREAALVRAGRAAEDYAHSHTADQMVRRYEQVYADCLRRRPARTARRIQDSRRSRCTRVLMVGPRPEQIGGMTSVIDTLMASPLRESFDLHRCWPPEPCTAGRWGATWRHLRALGQLSRTIRRTRADIVHIHTCSFFSFYRSLLDAAVARVHRRRVCLHIHGGRFAEFCAYSGPIGRWLIRRGCEAADAVLVLSRAAQTSLRPHLGHSNLAVLPNGVISDPRSQITPANTVGPCRFVFLGALVRAKGLHELIEGRRPDARRRRTVRVDPGRPNSRLGAG